MYELFARTLSQGLQAFMPIAIGIAWLRLRHQEKLLSPVRWAVVSAVPLAVATGWLFALTPYQQQCQAVLAASAAALAIAVVFRISREVQREADPRTGGRPLQWAVGATALLLMVRQAMEIAAVFGAATIQLRSLEASAVIGGGAALAAIAAAGWVWLGKRLPARAVLVATGTFAVLFLAQIAFFAFHKSAEARFLPSGELLDAATEPYGPDSMFGYRISWLLIALPLAAALSSVVVAAVRPGDVSRGWTTRTRRTALVASGVIAAACLLLAGVKARDAAPPKPIESAPVAGEAITIAAAPHLLFRETGTYKNYGLLSMAPLAGPNGGRAAAGLRCERISFAAGHGICLQADRGVLTTYQAVTFDENFKPRASLKLDGSPSRTRISPDGRVGSITVFLTGQVHGYAASSFSTKTILMDMGTGDVLGDLEGFSTWRDGARFTAADFNFWGVTFARESNTFYATLQTAGKTYLVRGDLGLRKLTVVHENVECPSISPDNRLIAYKKRVGGNLAPWRLYVLDLATMQERAVTAEARSFDDQIEWLDDTHVLYAMAQSSQSAITDVWLAPIDASGPARIFLPQGESPVVVR
jgi:hypothetical protein